MGFFFWLSFQNQTKLRSTVQGSDVVEVCRGDGTSELIETQRLVPGDVILVPPTGCTMYCDAVLLSGTCIVNESMLTGDLTYFSWVLPSFTGMDWV